MFSEEALVSFKISEYLYIKVLSESESKSWQVPAE